MVEFIKKNKTLISLFLCFVLLPINVNAATVSAVPDRITFYRAFNNTQVGSISSLSDYKVAGNTFYGGNVGNSEYSPSSARVFYMSSQFSSVPKNKQLTMMFTIFSKKPITSVSVDSNQTYATCSVLNTSYYNFDTTNDAMVYSIYCPKMILASSNFYININFVSDSIFNFPLAVQNTYTYYEDTTAQQIVDGINGEDKPQTPVDDSKVNDYESKEEALINKDSLDQIDNISIAVDSNTNLFIWNLIEQILNTHELIFSLVITLLSIGIIKLILNR